MAVYVQYVHLLIIAVSALVFKEVAGWFSSDETTNSPIILWWTPFTGEPGNWRTCGENNCFFTENRSLLHDDKTKVSP